MRRERDAMPEVGAHFSVNEAGEEMFSFVIDGGSIIGPRKATDEDRQKHAEAYEDFLAGATAPEGEAPPKRRGGRRKA